MTLSIEGVRAVLLVWAVLGALVAFMTYAPPWLIVSVAGAYALALVTYITYEVAK